MDPTLQPEDESDPGASPSHLIRGPKWRTRTTPARRHRAAAVTFAVIVATGATAMVVAVWVLAWLGAPQWIALSSWWLPTIATVAWTLVRPRIAEVTDDDDDSWFGYAIRWALVGELETRPAPVRVISALLFGAPVVWSVSAFGVLTVIGIV